jgi:ribosomal protein S18 acetylase RimI-like enzyme
MKIRKITPDDDFDAISRVYARSWKAAYKGIVPQDYLDGLPENKWSQMLKKSVWTSLVLIEEGEIIGTSMVCLGRDEAMADWGEIVSIYLLPEYFGRGYGKPLLDSAIAELKGMGYKFIYLWVLEDNKRARAFYEKNGFTASPDRHVDNIGGKDLVEIRYIYFAK